MSNCDAEMCSYWTGNGCICAVMDITAEEAEDEWGPVPEW